MWLWKLKKRLQSPSEEIRCETVKALGKLSNPEAFEILVQTLNDTNKHVRSAAAVALGKYGDRSS